MNNKLSRKTDSELMQLCPSKCSGLIWINVFTVTNKLGLNRIHIYIEIKQGLRLVVYVWIEEFSTETNCQRFLSVLVVHLMKVGLFVCASLPHICKKTSFKYFTESLPQWGSLCVWWGFKVSLVVEDDFFFGHSVLLAKELACLDFWTAILTSLLKC